VKPRWSGRGSTSGSISPLVATTIQTIGRTLVTYARDAVIEEVRKVVLDEGAIQVQGEQIS
jgi:hypothetical protein